jgi:Rieske Fe-S protein
VGALNITRLSIFLFSISALLLLGCEQKRPPGFLYLGKITEIAEKSGFLEDKQIYIHRDNNGVVAMSTLCSYDLSKLKLVQQGKYKILATEFNESQYDLWGRVLRGPTTKDLPFYSVRIDSGEYGSAKDSLYAEIGKEVPREWRLAIK